MTTPAIADPAVEETPLVVPEVPAEPVTSEVEPAPEISADIQAPVEEPVVETLDSLFEKHPSVRDDYEQRLKVRENAAAQRRESQLRREAGTLENTRTQVKRFMETVVAPLGVDTSEVPQQALDYMYMLAAESSVRQIAEALPRALMANYELTPEQRLAALEARDELVTLADGSTSPNYDAYAKALIESAVTNRTGSLKLADLPDSAPLRREIRAEAAKIAASEIKAAKLEAQPKIDAAPAGPSGSAPGTNGSVTWASIDKAYTDSQWSNLDPAKKKQLSDAANAALMQGR